MRKPPIQARSKERVARILDATEALIIANGVASLSVAEIAARADVAIGSLYQYFRNQDEILRALCARHYDVLRSSSSAFFNDIDTVADFTRNLRAALMTCWNYTRENVGYRHLFFDVQAWEIIADIDWEDTLLNARRMGDALARMMPNIPERRITALCIIIGDAASGTARLAARVDDMQDELFCEFLDMVESRVFSLLQENTAVERNRAGKGKSQVTSAG